MFLNSISFQQRNIQIKQQNEGFKQKLKELQKLNALVVNLLQQHIDAGCCLPEDCNECVSLTNQLHENNLSLEQSNNNTDPLESGSPVEANQGSPSPVQCEVYTVSTDPKALFSGEILPDMPQSPPRPQQLMRHQTTSNTARQAFATKKYHKNQTNPSSQISPSGQIVTQNANQMTTPPAQSIAASFHVSAQSQNPVSARAVTSSTLSTQQCHDQVWKLAVLEMNGKSCRVLINEKGQWKRLPEQSETNNDSSSTLLPNEKSNTSAQVWHGQELEKITQKFISTGKMNSTGLRGDFQHLTHTSTATYHENPSGISNLMGNNPLKGKKPDLIDSAHAAVGPILSQHKLNIPPSSFTQDLSMYGIRQKIPFQAKGHALQSQTGESRVVLPVNTHSPSSLGEQHVGGPRIVSQPRDRLSLAHKSMPHLRGENQSPVPLSSCDSSLSNCGSASIVCAPAMLDMMSRSELSSSLQNTLKASFSDAGRSVPQSGPPITNESATAALQGASTSGDLTRILIEKANTRGHQAAISISDTSPQLKLQNQSEMSTVYGNPEMSQGFITSTAYPAIRTNGFDFFLQDLD